MAVGAATAILADSNATAIAALSVASLVVGYGLLAGLWYFVFSPGAERRAERRSRAAQEAVLAQEAGETGLAPGAAAHREDDPTRLSRRIPARRR